VVDPARLRLALHGRVRGCASQRCPKSFPTIYRTDTPRVSTAFLVRLVFQFQPGAQRETLVRATGVEPASHRTPIITRRQHRLGNLLPQRPTEVVVRCIRNHAPLLITRSVFSTNPFSRFRVASAFPPRSTHSNTDMDVLAGCGNRDVLVTAVPRAARAHRRSGASTRPRDIRSLEFGRLALCQLSYIRKIPSE
jgi:hypothetical protein